MAKKQKKPTGLIVATSVFAALFTLSAVVIGLFVGFNADTVQAAIKNKETSFALSSEVENATAEKNAAVEAAQAEKEQALLDAEAEKTEAVESAKKQTLLDRHVLGIDNVEDLVDVELNDSTWSSVATQCDYRPIENNTYYTIYYMITEDNKETFVNYLKSLNLEADDKYVMMRTESGFEIYAQWVEGTSNIGICIGDDAAIPFGYDRNNDSLVGGSFSNPDNKIFSVGITDTSIKYGIHINEEITYVADNQEVWGTFFAADQDCFYSEENATPHMYFYTQPLELPGVDFTLSWKDSIDAIEEKDMGLKMTATVNINGEDVTLIGVVGRFEVGYGIMLGDSEELYGDDTTVQVMLMTDCFMYDFENELGIYPDGNTSIGGASLIVQSNHAIESFTITSIEVGTELVSW